MKIDIGRQIGAVSRRSRTASTRAAGPRRRSRAAATTPRSTTCGTRSPTPSASALVPADQRRPATRRALPAQGNAGGTITRCEPPRHLARDLGVRRRGSWVTVALTQDGDGGTRLELEHMAHVEDELWEQYGPGAVGVGWDLGPPGPRAAPRDGAARRSRRGDGLVGSAEGKAFVRGSSEDWCRAVDRGRHRGGGREGRAPRSVRTAGVRPARPSRPNRRRADARVRHPGRPGAPPHPGAAARRRAFLRRHRRGDAARIRHHQSAVSQHLRVLRESGFASVRNDGTRRLYSMDTAPCAKSTPGSNGSAASGSRASTRSRPRSRGENANDAVETSGRSPR